MVKTRTQLGSLEIAALERLWRDGSHSAKTLHQIFLADRKLNINTIQSTLDRLYRKRLLTRRKQSHAFIYECRTSRRELLGKLLTDVIEQISGGEVEPVLSSFIDYAEGIDKQILDELEQLIEQRKRSSINK